MRNEKYFANLDGVCGDGDFGTSLAAGFSKVIEQWTALDRSTPGATLKSVSLTIASCVGGVSGAIWGTAFLRASLFVAGARPDLTAEDAVAMLRAAAEGIKKRGQSDLGDKTLLDAYLPAVDEFARVVREGGGSADAIRAASVIARQKAKRSSRGSPSAAAHRTRASGAAAPTWDRSPSR